MLVDQPQRSTVSAPCARTSAFKAFESIPSLFTAVDPWRRQPRGCPALEVIAIRAQEAVPLLVCDCQRRGALSCRPARSRLAKAQEERRP